MAVITAIESMIVRLDIGQDYTFPQSPEAVSKNMEYEVPFSLTLRLIN